MPLHCGPAPYIISNVFEIFFNVHQKPMMDIFLNFYNLTGMPEISFHESL